MQHPIGKAVDQEIERRRIRREVEKALSRTAELRAEVRKLEEHYQRKGEGNGHR